MTRARRATLSMGFAALLLLGARPQSAAETPPNLLLVTLDTTRADRLGCYGYRAALTPNLDALAARGTRFTQAFSSSPLTLPAHTTLMTGLQPPGHGLHVNGKQALSPSVPTLAETLRSHGYRTGAFVAAYVLDSRFGLDRGFEVYDDDLKGARPQQFHERLSVYRPGNLVVDAALRWLDGAATGDRPFFAWVHLYDPHHPDYVNPELAGTRFARVASYDSEVAFMDLQVGRLLRFLNERNLGARTLVVAVADHGEGLGEHDEMEHGYLLNAEALHVPLLIALPGRVRVGHRVDAVTSLVDVLPTVLDVLGVAPPARGHGRSLRAALEGEAIPSLPSYAETDMPYSVFGWSPLRSLTTERWRYVRTARPELYDRAADPAEHHDLHVERADVTEELNAALATIEAGFDAAPTDAPAPALDAEARRRLEALGYLEPVAGAGPPPTGQALRDIKDMLPVKHRNSELALGLATGTIGPERALEIAHELVERSPESPSFRNHLGAMLLAAGRLDEAAEQLTEAVRLQPDLAEAHSNLGLVRVRQGRPAEGVAHLHEALRLNPDLADTHLALGNAEMALGNADLALRQFAAAVRLDPESADAHMNLGNALTRRGLGSRAALEYRAALRLRPGFALAHHNLATLLARRESSAGALAHEREAVRLAPDLAVARHGLGRLLAEEGETAKAIEQYVEAIRLAPEIPEFRDDLAAAYASEGHWDQAIATAREAVARARRAGRRTLAGEIRRRASVYRGLAAKENGAHGKDADPTRLRSGLHSSRNHAG